MPSKPKAVSQASPPFSRARQDTPWAGVPRTALGISHEPALQHKKRVEGPQSSFSINVDDGRDHKASDDFAVLGKQQKFAPNVQYGLKSSQVSKSVERGRDLNNNSSNNNNSANVPPPPKQMKMAERQSRTRGRRDLAATETRSSKKEASKENLTPTSPPPAPRTKDRGANGQQKASEKEGLKDKNLADMLPKGKGKAAVDSRGKDSMNHAVQTNVEKGVMLANEEAPADFSLKYKAGVAPVRAVRKPSEYQKEYTWKKGVPASPLISAEQIVHKSNANISPVKKAVLPKKTEYQMQFQTHQLPEPLSLAPKVSQQPPVQRGRGKTQVKRSKSAGAGLSPERLTAAGSSPVTSANDPRLLRQSRNTSPVPKVPVAHGQLKHKATEYRNNYKAPARFSYEGGAWRAACPAHLLQNMNGVSEVQKAVTVEEGAPPSWFAEVMELRRRANEYKKRAQGTHFSREHLVQLMARQTGYWDAADTARSSSALSSLDALALEPARPAAGVPSFTKVAVPVDKVSTMAVRGDSPDEQDDDDASNMRPAKRDGRRGRRTKTAWQEEVEALNTNQNAACDALSMEDGEEAGDAGRLSTPVLRQRGEKSQRHHLDRTTPSMGGVLLSIPEQHTPRSGDSEDTLTESQQSPSPRPKLSTGRLYTSPLLGKPTPDTHALRDDSADCDQALDVHYISSPQATLAKADRNLKALQRRMNANIPTTIDERMAATYNKDRGMFQADDLPLVKTRQQDDDDDALSLSAQSVASSCSLASDVYERAKHRRDHFWGTKSDQ